MRKDERKALYLITGVFIAVIIFYIVQRASLNSGVPPTTANGYGLIALIVTMAFWIGTLRVWFPGGRGGLFGR